MQSRCIPQVEELGRGQEKRPMVKVLNGYLCLSDEANADQMSQMFGSKLLIYRIINDI